MKFIRWKIFLITALVCLSPILLGLALWDQLPDTLAIHFNINNEPDNFASKGFVVFGLPALMVLLQAICCFINDINSHKHGRRVKFERANKWIIPVMSVLLQTVTLGYGLGWNIDIRKFVALLVGGILLVVGNYLPKFDYVKNHDVDTDKARKINRFVGYGSVIMGLLSMASAFLPPVTTLVWLILLIPYAIICVIYSVRVIRSK